MEHEILALIRTKVAQAEVSPVAWRKDRVWQHIRLHAPAKRHKPVYFAAASIVIAVFLVSAIFQADQQKSMETVKSPERSISTRISESTANAEEVECARIPDAMMVRNKPGQYVPSKQSLTPRLRQGSGAPQEREEMVAPEQQSAQETTVVSVAKRTVIKAIIGFVPIGDSGKFTRLKDKKVRLRFMKALERESGANSTEEEKELTARIK